MDLPTLIVFGPQTPWPSEKYLEQLRATLLNDPQLSPLVRATRNLPDLWFSLIDTEPSLAKTPALEDFVELSNWVEYGRLSRRTEAAPNSLLTPLTVIIHAVQYTQYFRRTRSDVSQIDLLESTSHAGIQGLCTGFLTAAAVASSNDIDDLLEHIAVVLRLAAIVGVFVSLNGIYAESAKETTCFVAQWGSEPQYMSLLDVLEQYPAAYVSVVKASTRVTITTAKATYPALSKTLRTSGLIIKEIGLEGLFYHPDNEQALASALRLCNSRADLQLPTARGLLVPLRCTSDSQVIVEGSLHEIAMKSLLCEQSNWRLTIAAATSKLDLENDKHVLEFGLVDWETGQSDASELLQSFPAHAIAVTGMACRFPGADSVDEFWELLCAGTSMVSDVPIDRFASKGLRRSPDDTKMFGNFLHNIDSFDHKFFKISLREASSMGPQQRLCLEVAYQAMESSGYFTGQVNAPSVGCYLGVGSVDYQENIGSYAPNAFSALGSLRAFISGKISHYFGWTGPSITFDTACSSSLVAIHSACKALNADGCCRGEGCGLVVLKRLQDAIATGEPILGVISGFAVNQGSNTTPITVPDPESQTTLYRTVLSLAGVSLNDVNYVEAHGTGTPRKDPIECNIIRQVFGGPQRAQNLRFGSVKGNIGHLEAASGAAGLIKPLLMIIKPLLMIQKGSIPKQAGFQLLNPQITPPLSHDKMEIPLETLAWDTDYRAICVNNYGAAGSNAALLVPQLPTHAVLNRDQRKSLPSKHIFQLISTFSKFPNLVCHCTYGILLPVVACLYRGSEKDSDLLADLCVEALSSKFIHTDLRGLYNIRLPWPARGSHLWQDPANF
ncbi:ketoacyl-synt-domain-containing protein [Mytilinidion resinicola]|uniref:Ketoacyl-synt-domain-containing protein n=1 Tax=Mytilinidion resinicola TaxID=574789 RepID=A0A6A6Y4I7_9PEZI|nr:ketoacyl-synt-domain-containing protein [Mytilinidion resinicola]KAF2803145.1 ketoacyl-synt-domain-containing protein [Mytilinidion resinicola]